MGKETSQTFCIVCGLSEDEVRKLFCFPRQSERSKKWQINMGMKPRDVVYTHIKICDRHFSEDSFIPFTFVLRLKAGAIPTIAFADQPRPGTSGPTDRNGVREKKESESFPPPTPRSSASTDFIRPNCSSNETPKIMNGNKRKRQKSVESAAVHERLQTVTRKGEDRFDITGKAIAAKLRSLPHIQRIFADKLIQDVLFEAELGTLSRSCKLLIEPTTEMNLTRAETVQSAKTDAKRIRMVKCAIAECARMRPSASSTATRLLCRLCSRHCRR